MLVELHKKTMKKHNYFSENWTSYKYKVKSELRPIGMNSRFPSNQTLQCDHTQLNMPRNEVPIPCVRACKLIITKILINENRKWIYSSIYNSYNFINIILKFIKNKYSYPNLVVNLFIRQLYDNKIRIQAH